jgi:hypothetical protein
LDKSDVSNKGGDDYPVRIHITFAYNPESNGFFAKLKRKTASFFTGKTHPKCAINYIWANNTPVGTIIPSPYIKDVKMIVVENGNANVNTWVQMERNIVEDYRVAFGEDPPFISAIAIMTDSDDTGESVTAYYGDIVMKNVPAQK